jgi:MtN3 and saliva related transmembrane protein
MIVTTVVGYLAAACGTILMLPQVIRSWRTRQVSDVSRGMVWLYVINCALWLAYGLLADLRPVWLTNAAALLISLVQLGLTVRYGRGPTG